jgi:hypothetical protein
MSLAFTDASAAVGRLRDIYERNTSFLNAATIAAHLNPFDCASHALGYYRGVLVFLLGNRL